MPCRDLSLILALGFVLAGPARVSAADDPLYPVGSVTSDAAIVCNFNGTAIPCPRTIWFIAVGKLSTTNLAPVTIYMQDQHITFTANSINYDLPVPDGATTFSTTATTATTTFTGGNTWDTTVPVAASGNQFYSALAWPVPCPAGLPGGIPVTWTATFLASQPGVQISWTWSAGVYTSFSTNYNSLGVKASDSNQYLPYMNSDKAGTPENFTSFVVGGARGGGGSNYTGSLCSTVSEQPTSAQSATWGRLKTIYR